MSTPPNNNLVHPPQTNAELLDHVLYEMHMLIWTYRAILSRPEQKELKSVFLESFLIHARCLNEFFCTDGNVADYIKPWRFLAGYPKDPKQHNEIKRMHREIAHLTPDRKKPGAKDGKGLWDIGKTARPIFLQCQKFLQAISGNAELMAYKYESGITNADRTAQSLNVFKQELTPSVYDVLARQPHLDSSSVAYPLHVLSATDAGPERTSGTIQGLTI